MKINVRFNQMKRAVAGCLLIFSALLAHSVRSQSQNNPPVQAEGKRPNIIFIYTDDQRYDALSVVQEAQGLKARFPWFSTPNIDRIAKEGVRFTNAFVINSLCSPSRAAMLSSRYNHFNGIANNHTELTDTSASYATILSKAGYATGFIGKWHMANQQGKRPGFEYSFSFFGQGRYLDCPFQLNGEQIVQTKGWVDDISTDSAIAFITRKKDVPFLLSLAFKSSHGPWTPPERLANAFENVDLIKSASESAKAPYVGKVDPGWVNPHPQPVRKTHSWTADHAEMIRNYFRVLKAVDENVGRILNLLDSLNLTSNTIVVYSTDNGYFLGEHDLGDKRAAYEESMRIPLLVRYPGKFPPGKTVDDFVLNLDIAPTFVDFAGVKAPGSFQGRSWLPLVEGKAKNWRTSFFYEYFYEDHYATPTILAVRTKTAKLVKYPGQDNWTELFDLKNDPQEKHNLFNTRQGAKLKAQMEKEFSKDSAQVHFRIPDYADKRILDKDGRYLPPSQRSDIQNNVLTR